MRTRIIFAWIALLSLVGSLSAQSAETISLGECLRAAEAKMDYDQLADLERSRSEIAVDLVRREKLPDMYLSASSTWQNAQLGLDIPLPGVEISAPPRNINRVWVQVNQTIYDGSLARYKQMVEEATGEVAQREIDLRRFELRSRVTAAYLTAVLLSQQQEILQKQDSLIGAREKEVEAAVKGGVLLRAELQSLQAERLRLRQSISELEASRLGLLGNLRILTGLVLPAEYELTLPKTEEPGSQNGQLERPELRLMEAQRNLLTQRSEMLQTMRLPRLQAFGQFGYGNPGLNLFDTGWNPVVYLGLNFSLPIYDWGEVKRRREQISYADARISREEWLFESQVTAQLQQIADEIEGLQKLSVQDKEIIDLRKEVVRSYEARLNNGTVTASAYLAELNLLQQAKLNGELHWLRIASLKVQYHIIAGHEIQ